MHKIETLPKHIEYKGFYYELRMHITAWDKICLCYFCYRTSETLFPQVINHVSVQSLKQDSMPEDIIDVYDFDAAVRVLEKRIKDAVKANFIKVKI